LGRVFGRARASLLGGTIEADYKEEACRKPVDKRERRLLHSPATRATCLTKVPHAIHNFVVALRGDVGNMP